MISWRVNKKTIFLLNILSPPKNMSVKLSSIELGIELGKINVNKNILTASKFKALLVSKFNPPLISIFALCPALLYNGKHPA